MANIHDVAKKVGVSIGTVSRAFCNRSDIKRETRERVLEAARELNYSPYAGARNMRRRRDGGRELNFNIGWLFLGPTSLGSQPFMGDLLEAIETTLSERGFTMSVLRQNPDGGAPRDKQLSNVDGIIVCGGGKVVEEISARLPTLTVDYCDPDLGAFGVVPDYRQGVSEAVERLLAAGHTRIVSLSGSDPKDAINPYFAREAQEGFLDAHEQAGVSPADYGPIEQALTPEAGYRAADKLLRLNPSKRPQAILASDGVMLGVYRAAYELGLRIPDDLSLIGIDGIIAGAYYPPPLTTVDAHIADLGRRAVQLLLEFVDSGKARRGMELLTPTLVERASAKI